MQRISATGLLSPGNPSGILAELRQHAGRKKIAECDGNWTPAEPGAPPSGHKVARELAPWVRGGQIYLGSKFIRALPGLLWNESTIVCRLFYGLLAAVASGERWSWRPADVRAALEYRTLTAAQIAHARERVEQIGLRVEGERATLEGDDGERRWICAAYLRAQSRRSDRCVGAIKTLVLGHLGYAYKRGGNVRCAPITVPQIAAMLRSAGIESRHRYRYADLALRELIAEGWVRVRGKLQGSRTMFSSWRLELRAPQAPVVGPANYPAREARSGAPGTPNRAKYLSGSDRVLTSFDPPGQGSGERHRARKHRADDWKRLLADARFQARALARIGRQLGAPRSGPDWAQWARQFVREVRQLTRTAGVRDPIAVAVWRLKHAGGALLC